MTNPTFAKLMKSLSKAFSADLIKSLSDYAAWQWIHLQAPPPLPSPDPTRICFSGFSRQDKADLGKLARLAGFRVSRSVSKRLAYLCIGTKPGRVKLERANQREVPVIDLNGFYQVAHGDTSDLRFVQVTEPELPDFPEFQSENLSQPEKVGREFAVA